MNGLPFTETAVVAAIAAAGTVASAGGGHCDLSGCFIRPKEVVARNRRSVALADHHGET